MQRAALASPEGRCVFLFAARQCRPSRLPHALHYAFPFHSGACLKERGKEGKDPRAHTPVNNEALCSYSLMRPLAPQIPEQQQWGLAAASHLPPSLQPSPGSLVEAMTACATPHL